MARGDAKQVLLGNEARQRLIEGAKIAYEVASKAYGPVSGNVAIEKAYGPVLISHDGITNLRDLFLEDKFQDFGVDILTQASKKSADVAGDGSTASVILGYNIMHLANQRIAAGFNAMGLRRGIDGISEVIKAQLDSMAIPVTSDDELARVATISAGDEQIGMLVADTIKKVGGVGIAVEEYEGLGVIQDIVEGIHFNKGWTMPHFVTNRQTEEAIHDNAHVLILEKKVSANQDIVKLLEMVHANTDSKTVLIVGNVAPPALDTCALTNLQGQVKVCVVNPPVYGDQVLPFLEDLATQTGGRVIPSSLPADKVDKSYLGHANRIIVGRSATTIIEGKGDKAKVDERIKLINEQLKSENFTPMQKERMEFRLAKLQGRIGIIRVGGASPTATTETKLRVEDAIHATRAAKEEGIVPGGGTALVRLSENINPEDMHLADKNELEGARVVLEALTKPFELLMSNAGLDSGYYLHRVKESPDRYGINVLKGTELVNLIKEGVIDPVKVIKQVVENACSAAGIAITIQASIAFDRKYQLEQVALNKLNQ